ncbi:50S ribosomal protein L11 methyltransferase [Clostridium sp. BJN0001]|uniref:50S ribosomal protein L11 methyltransferase n=1 Tax=Clostridium sp. BJN0001 TaxID=2930219 RepID=UPI001FD05912|nr:50S ribosomal protein L11 methyltransferase [Clostridium sp. BJN0001]
MEGIWNEISVITDKTECLEIISSIFYDLGCPNVAMEDPNDLLSRDQGPLTWDFADINILEHKGKKAVCKGYFEDDVDINEIKEKIEKKLLEIEKSGLDIGNAKVCLKKMHEQDWANNWKKYYKPVKVTDRIVIKPEWEKYEKKDGEHVIELDPGMAFGTGTHETTRMCLKALDEYINDDNSDTVIDVGCGSGILTIAAKMLGANKAIGVDLDPIAVDSAKGNAKLNNLTGIEILEGNLLDVVSEKADIIVANIIAQVIVSFVEDVKKTLKSGGYFICSGIIHEKLNMVKEKLKECNFDIIKVDEDGEWNAIVSRLK